MCCSARDSVKATGHLLPLDWNYVVPFAHCWCVQVPFAGWKCWKCCKVLPPVADHWMTKESRIFLHHSHSPYTLKVFSFPVRAMTPSIWTEASTEMKSFGCIAAKRSHARVSNSFRLPALLLLADTITWSCKLNKVPVSQIHICFFLVRPSS